MKRKLFIGSSSEGLAVSKQVKQIIEKHCGDWIEASVWNDGSIFSLNKSALDTLITASRRYDYGILVATKDDRLWFRKKKYSVPRDNVIFELGMFLGSLGLTRAYVLVEDKNKLPTDYNGVTASNFKRKTDGMENSVADIVKALNQTKSSFNIKPVPSVAIAVGYFDSLIQPVVKKSIKENTPLRLEILIPKEVDDIEIRKTLYEQQNPSEEVSFGDNGGRPRIMKYSDMEDTYWDIPTTLSTLGRLMDLFLPSQEIGLNREKQDWTEHELRNFKGTIETLVEDCVASRGRVVVKFL